MKSEVNMMEASIVVVVLKVNVNTKKIKQKYKKLIKSTRKNASNVVIHPKCGPYTYTLPKMNVDLCLLFMGASATSHNQSWKKVTHRGSFTVLLIFTCIYVWSYSNCEAYHQQQVINPRIFWVLIEKKKQIAERTKWFHRTTVVAVVFSGFLFFFFFVGRKCLLCLVLFVHSKCQFLLHQRGHYPCDVDWT